MDWAASSNRIRTQVLLHSLRLKCHDISSRGKILPQTLVSLSVQSVHFSWRPDLRPWTIPCGKVCCLSFPLFIRLLTLHYMVLFLGSLLHGLIVSSWQLNTCKLRELTQGREWDYNIYIKTGGIEFVCNISDPMKLCSIILLVWVYSLTHTYYVNWSVFHFFGFDFIYKFTLVSNFLSFRNLYPALFLFIFKQYHNKNSLLQYYRLHESALLYKALLRKILGHSFPLCAPYSPVRHVFSP